MYDNDLDWRLASIHAELDNLTMFAAAWTAMGDDSRAEVRMRWSGLVCQPIIAIRWHWRRYAMWGESPGWWSDLDHQLSNHAALIDYMELAMPEMSIPQRPSLRLPRI